MPADGHRFVAVTLPLRIVQLRGNIREALSCSRNYRFRRNQTLPLLAVTGSNVPGSGVRFPGQSTHGCRLAHRFEFPGADVRLM